jgi:hypothetical protein
MFSVRRRWAVQLLVGVLVAGAAMVGVTTGAGAKGPLPVIGEPAEPTVAGQASVIPISTEWPDGPSGPLSNDVYGDELPWTLVAVAPGVAVSQGEPVAVRHVAPGHYTADWTPPDDGEWRLTFVVPDHTGTNQEFAPMGRIFAVEGPPGSSLVFWPLVLGLGVVVAAVGLTLVAVSRRRAGRPTEPNQLAPSL